MDALLTIEDATVQVGNKIFFENLSFVLHRHQKIALVGKNGAGKTTLMNMIRGTKELDEGKYWIMPHVKIGIMRQEVPNFVGTVERFVTSDVVGTLEDWDLEYRLSTILENVGLKPDQQMQSLSGGLLRRAELARALIEQADILLLDEPTNHLDLETIEWLEQYLAQCSMTLMIVSHDREFLARVTNQVFWLDRQKLKISPRGFRDFQEWSQGLLEQEWRSIENREARVDIEMEWAQRGVKARVKRNTRRLAQAYAEQERLDKDISDYKRAVRRIEQPVVEFDRSSEIVVEFFNVSKSFYKDTEKQTEERRILHNFSCRIKRGERIGILGANGSGKSCFLKLIVGQLTADKGKVKTAFDLNFSYFDQFREDLKPNMTIMHNLCPLGSDHLLVRGKMRHVCGYIKDFLFAADDAWRLVETLSGGQKNRISLAKILANPGSFILLDEPTNDLDMDTLTMIEDVLNSYQGTLIIVSHDRDFLNSTVDKLLVFEGDGVIQTINGGYHLYEEWRNQQKANNIESKNTKTKESHKPAAKPAIEIVEQPTEIVPTAQTAQVAKKKVSFGLKVEFEKLPQKIEEYGKRIQELQEKLQDGNFYLSDKDGFYKCSADLERSKSALNKAEERWLELSAIIEE